MSVTFEPYGALCPELMVLSAFVAKCSTSRDRELEEDELFLNDDDEEVDDDEDDDYWDPDEFGIDPEDLYAANDV